MSAFGHRAHALALAGAGLIALGVLWSGCEGSFGGEEPAAVSDRARADTPGEDTPPLDPDVVGPRLVREWFSPQLLFWLRTYRARERGRVRRTWTTAARGTDVVLRLSSTRSKRRPAWRFEARWKIAVALDRQLTRRQLTILGGSRGIVPANAAARQLSSFPRIDPGRGARSQPVALVANVLGIDPRGRRLEVSILPAESVPDGLVTRTGRDFALLAGLSLIERSDVPASTSHALAPTARIRAESEPITAHRLVALATARRDALVILSWRNAGRVALARLLARPVDGIELIGVR